MRSVYRPRTEKKRLFDRVSEALIFSYLDKRLQSRESKLGDYREEPKIKAFASDWLTAHLLVKGRYEIEELDDLITVMSHFGSDLSKCIAVDIGAHIGNHTLFFAEKFAKVIAFEASSANFTLLQMNTSHLTNAQIHQTLVGRGGIYELGSSNFTNSGATSFSEIQFQPADLKGRKFDNEQIHSIPLDIFLTEDHLEIGLVKVDAEGMEYEVLSSATETLRKHKPIIAFEQLQHQFILNADIPETETIQFLRKLGYEIFVVRKSIFESSRFLSTVSGETFSRSILRKLFDKFVGLFYRYRSIEISDLVRPGSYPMLLAAHKTSLEAIL